MHMLVTHNGFLYWFAIQDMVLHLIYSLFVFQLSGRSCFSRLIPFRLLLQLALPEPSVHFRR